MNENCEFYDSLHSCVDKEVIEIGECYTIYSQ